MGGVGVAGEVFLFCAGIRDALACFARCPCAGRHLLVGWLRRWGCLPVVSLASA